MMWMWLSTIVVLVGAELNSEIEHQTARDSTVGPEKPLGTRGAVMADTVGAAVLLPGRFQRGPAFSLSCDRGRPLVRFPVNRLHGGCIYFGRVCSSSHISPDSAL
jgi:hypothetical protein